MKTCCVCGKEKESRWFSVRVEGGDVCTSCCLLGKVPRRKVAPQVRKERVTSRAVRVWFGGETLTFQSMAAAARWVGCSDLTIRRVALGLVPTSKQLGSLRVKFLGKRLG